jgi:hypothetical protein
MQAYGLPTTRGDPGEGGPVDGVQPLAETELQPRSDAAVQRSISAAHRRQELAAKQGPDAAVGSDP